MATKTTNRCNFCGRSQNEVNMLITGPSVNICDECVKMAYEIPVQFVFRHFLLGGGKWEEFLPFRCLLAFDVIGIRVIEYEIARSYSQE